MENKRKGREGEEEEEEEEGEEMKKIDKFYSLLRRFREGRDRRRKELEELQKKQSNRKTTRTKSTWLPSFEWEDFTTQVEFRKAPLILPTPQPHTPKPIKEQEHQQHDPCLDLKLSL